MADPGDIVVGLVDNVYAKSIIIFLFFLVIAFVFLSLVKSIVNAVARRTSSKLDDILIEKLEVPFSILVGVIGLKFAILPLSLDENVYTVTNHAINTLLITIVTVMVIRISNIIVHEMESRFQRMKTVEAKTVFPLVQRFINIFVVVLGFLFIMVEWDVQIGPFLASLGIAGLGVSFALKDSLANVFGGISLILDKNFKVGDVIRLETGEQGQVLEIGLRSTKIKTWDNEVIIMPNNLLSNIKFTNVAKPDITLRLTLIIGVDYASDPNKVKKVIHETLAGLQSILPEPKPIVRFIKMNDFSLDFKVLFWINDYINKAQTEDEATTALWYALKKNKINIPFPTRTLFMQNAKSQGKPVSGKKLLQRDGKGTRRK